MNATIQDPVENLERFESTLAQYGAANAPNGALYILHSDSQGNTCERTHDGERMIVVGFNGARFPSKGAALAWAIVDGRHELPGIYLGCPLSERKQIV